MQINYFYLKIYYLTFILLITCSYKAYNQESCQGGAGIPDNTCKLCTDIDGSFVSDCPNCQADGLGDVAPCWLEPVNEAVVHQTNFNYVLIFDDEFTGDALDMSKWQTANQMGVHSGRGNIDYDDGKHFIFTHPGVSIWDEYLANPITAKEVDYDRIIK
ncbi:hypothetical protein [Ferroplasma sp.]|uniref:hypothetical protein n=1 Tax=Ferroplasma sp. TaxID=2591003 RepID=UPI002605F98C|nr:hypothetical protein [Ferroplasma sp.]